VANHPHFEMFEVKEVAENPRVLPIQVIATTQHSTKQSQSPTEVKAD
jgi:hypothetical protein